MRNLIYFTIALIGFYSSTLHAYDITQSLPEIPSERGAPTPLPDSPRQNGNENEHPYIPPANPNVVLQQQNDQTKKIVNDIATSISQLQMNLPPNPDVQTLENFLSAHAATLSAKDKDALQNLISLHEKLDISKIRATALANASDWNAPTLPADQKIQTLFASNHPIDAVNQLSQINEQTAQTPDQEAALKKYLDPDGLLKGLPPELLWAHDIHFQSTPTSVNGARTRRLINQVLASQASVYLNTDEDAKHFTALGNETIVGLAIADAMISAGDIAGNGLQSVLLHPISFMTGVAEGSKDFAIGTVALASEITFHTGTVVGGIARAFYEYDVTAQKISTWATTQWKNYQAADDAGKAEMIGKLTSNLLPAIVTGGAGVALEATDAVQLAALAEAIAPAASITERATIAGGLGALEIASPELAETLVTKNPEFAEGLAKYAQQQELAAGEVELISKFESGATHFMTRDDYNDYMIGGSYVGAPDSLFIIPKSDADMIAGNCNQSAEYLAQKLGPAPA